jgi:carboxymethylenebutenolidase
MTTITTREQTIAIPDGELGAHLAIPAAGRGPGIVLLHEIFGVGDYVRDAAARLAEAGYVVVAPDLFWRTQPGLELPQTDEGQAAGMRAAQQLDFAAAVGDAIAAMAPSTARPTRPSSTTARESPPRSGTPRGSSAR